MSNQLRSIERQTRRNPELRRDALRELASGKIQSEFKLPPEGMKEFMSFLNQPPVASPVLRDLLTKPSVIEQANQE